MKTLEQAARLTIEAFTNDDSVKMKRAITELREALQRLTDCQQEIEQESPWKELFWKLALTLKCLPSSFPEKNKHVLAKARLLIESTPNRIPLSQTEVVEGFCKQPHDVQFVAVFNAGVRFAEAAHGIKDKNNENT